MRSLGAPDILDLCDACEKQGSAARALTILARAEPQGAEQHRDLAIGHRDAMLMALRERTFGSRIELVSSCAACGATVEFDVTARELGLDLPQADAGPQSCRVGEHTVLVRAVTAGDVAEAEMLGDVEALRHALLGRCVLAVNGVEGAPLPRRTHADVETALEQLDPAADVEIELTCPACHAAWSVSFDPPEILWRDIKRQAGRLLSDVAELARIYHWSERDILAMPASRRRFYLEAAR